MERLTFDGLFCDLAVCQEVPCKYPDNGCSQRQVWERLKMFEDILGPTYDLSRLKELVEADRDGRILIKPCQLNDKLYMLCGRFGEKYEEDICDGFYIGRNGRLQVKAQGYTGNHPTYGEIGKTVFLSREAAEKDLEEQNG